MTIFAKPNDTGLLDTRREAAPRLTVTHQQLIDYSTNISTVNMDNKRLEKVNRLIQKELGDIFQKELKPKVPMLMITVTHVRVTSDLGYANVYLSIFGVDDKKKVVEEVGMNARAIRGMLGNRVRHQMRVVPELRFFEDDSLDYIENIDNLLHPEK